MTTLLRSDHADNGKTVAAGELEVAVVVAGHGHDGAGAVLHQDVVGDPDRNGLAGSGVDGVAAGEDTGLLPLAHLAGDQVLGRHHFPVGVHLGPVVGGGEGVDQGMFGCQDHEGGAEDGVGAGCEDL